MKWSIEESGKGPLGKYFFPGVLLAGSAVILVQILLPPSLQLRCPFHRWTGLPCPTCGATRCVQQIVDGEWMAAWQTQPLVFAALLFWGTLLAGYAVACLLGLPVVRVRLERRSERRALWFGLLLFMIGNWIYLLVTH